MSRGGLQTLLGPEERMCGCEPWMRLQMSCIACHVLDASAGGPALPNVGCFPVPQVAYAKTDSLAAGNFAYVFDADFYGHNVHGFGAGVIDPESTHTLNGLWNGIQAKSIVWCEYSTQ